jgi:RNA polymerase sigma-70 factor (sigma-E family)
MMAAMAFVGRPDDFALGRDEALVDLYRSEYRSLVRLACLLLDDRGAGEEVTQDAFVRLHSAWARVRDETAAAAYLRSTVLNLARSRMRRRLVARRHDTVTDRSAASAEDEAMVSTEQRRVLDALRALPRRQRECLALRYYLDLSEADIAATLRISKGSVKSHTSRGMAVLTRTLGADE